MKRKLTKYFITLIGNSETLRDYLIRKKPELKKLTFTNPQIASNLGMQFSVAWEDSSTRRLWSTRSDLIQLNMIKPCLATTYVSTNFEFQGQTSTNHFTVKLNPLLFTFYIWLYDFDPDFDSDFEMVVVGGWVKTNFSV